MSEKIFCFLAIFGLFAGTNSSEGGDQCMASGRVAARMAQLYSCDFEVFGIVQGKNDRKRTGRTK